MEKEFIRFLLYATTSGRIISTHQGEDLDPELNVGLHPIADGYVSGIDETVNGATHMVEDGYVIERPSLPTLASGTLPYLIDFSAYPGTTILAWNESGDQVLVSEQLELTETGSYRLEITPPWPYQVMEVTLDV